MSQNHIDQLARHLWDYLQLNQPLEACDIIFALGSSDTRVAKYAADLYQRGKGKYVVFSGGLAGSLPGCFLRPKQKYLPKSLKQTVYHLAISLPKRALATPAKTAYLLTKRWRNVTFWLAKFCYYRNRMPTPCLRHLQSPMARSNRARHRQLNAPHIRHLSHP